MGADAIRFNHLLPTPAGEIEPDALLDELFAGVRAGPDRPYTLANFVSSADGHATIEETSGNLGDEGDLALFMGLRQRVDAVLAGTTTMAKEGYGRLLASADRRARRLERGLRPEPLACLLTRGGHVPTSIPLFAQPEARVVVFGPAGVRQTLDACAAQVELVTLDPAEMTFAAALRRLRVDHGVSTLLCEGGPTVFAAMLGQGLVDELFLTLAPWLTGGGMGPAVTSGPGLAKPAPLSVRWLLERHGSLFARYAVDRA